MDDRIQVWMKVFKYGIFCCFMMLCGFQIMASAAGIYFLRIGDSPMAMGLLLGNLCVFQLASLLGILIFGMDVSGENFAVKRGCKFFICFSIFVFVVVGFFCIGILLNGLNNGLIALFAALGAFDGFFSGFLWTLLFRKIPAKC